MNPVYPIYIISKGRWESRLTSKALERMNVKYRIVIEPQELEQYSNVIDRKKILVLPFSNLGKGSIPARNWVWEHSIKEGWERHWILDDNLRYFRRNVNGERIIVDDGTIFNIAEKFVDRYQNIALAGFDYTFFSIHRSKPFLLNTRIYSCILIKNDIPYRWRGIYNEDTDLSIRVMKDDWCTVLFYVFLCDKIRTMTMKGGNTDLLYKNDEKMNGRLLMAQSLQRQHPSIVKIKKRWGRFQHVVDYSIFRRNKLIKKKGVKLVDKVNNFGMELVDLTKR